MPDLDVNRLLQNAHEQHEAQQAAQRQLQQALQATLANPARIDRINMSMTGVAQEGGQKILMVALPSGTRIDVPLPPQVARVIANQLLQEPDDGETPASQNGHAQ